MKSENGDIVACTIKGNFRLKGIKSTNPIAVGDHVEFRLAEKESEDNTNIINGLITNIIERKNYIIRKSPNLSKQSHIIASNIDESFLVVTINYPITTATFIDRFLVSAEAYRIPCSLIFNKIDRYNHEQTRQMDAMIELYEKIGYRCLKTSTKKILASIHLKAG